MYALSVGKLDIKQPSVLIPEPKEKAKAKESTVGQKEGKVRMKVSAKLTTQKAVQ